MGMITKFDTSEFLSVVIAEKAKPQTATVIKYHDLFTTSNKIVKKNRDIRIRMNTVSIKEFCNFLNDKCEVHVSCNETEITIQENPANKIAKLKRYNPTNDVADKFRREIKQF